jgi:polysaccharide deacetylase family protein (PEP-CTERM system associated)
LSFDVEEHFRIEAAAGLSCPASLREEYAARMEVTTRRLLDHLAAHRARATFFIVGQIAATHPALVRDIHEAGHEVASHSWDHQRVHCFTPQSFREDVRRSKTALEQATGAPVVGFRAPTFSVVRGTGWVIDVLAEEGFLYDSSIFPIRHDRYGVPDAPRTPFQAIGRERSLLELPPATLRFCGMNLPVAGGGYFRLFPLVVLEAGVKQLLRITRPDVAMLYFHPWEFDPEQPRLPLSPLSRWRTYVGVRRSTTKLKRLLSRYQFRRASDVAAEIAESRADLPEYSLVSHDERVVAVS